MCLGPRIEARRDILLPVSCGESKGDGVSEEARLAGGSYIALYGMEIEYRAQLGFNVEITFSPNEEITTPTVSMYSPRVAAFGGISFGGSL